MPIRNLWLAGEERFELPSMVLETTILPLNYSPSYKEAVSPKVATSYHLSQLLENLCNLTCANCTATLADCETETLVDSNRIDKLYLNCYVIARHNHLCSLRE